jgi:hypothetical protein
MFMRDPSRKAAVFAVTAALGVALGWAGIQRQGATGDGWVQGVMLAAGFAMTFVAIVLLVKAMFHAVGTARLQAGFGRIAEWHVGAVEWDKFRAFDAARSQSDPRFLANDLWVRRHTPAEGVDVIVGEKALIVDRSYHVLRMNGLPELRSISWLDNASTPGRPPDCLEFLLAYPRGRYGGIRHTSLRLPVPAAALEQGRQAHGHFAPALEQRQARGAIALRNPRRTLQICGAILAAGLAGLVWGWPAAVEANRNGEDMMPSIAVLVAGAAGVVFSLVLGVLTLLLRPKPTR